MGILAWQETRPAGDANKNWRFCVASVSGNVMVGCYTAGYDNGGQLFKSIDFGASWTEMQPVSNALRNWRCFAMDSDGSVMLAAHTSDYFSALANAAVTTTDTTLTDTRYSWINNYYVGGIITCNGKTMTVTSISGNTFTGSGGWSGGGNPGNGYAWIVNLGSGVYKSTNSGSSWTEIDPVGDSGDHDYQDCDMDSDGSVMVISRSYGSGSDLGKLYISTNTGVNWSEADPAGDEEGEYYVAVDDDGSVILAADYNRRLWLSTNTGSSWTEKRPAGDVNYSWLGCDIDSDGSVMIVGSYDRLWISSNSGSSWSEVRPGGIDADFAWLYPKLSSDGAVMIASQNDDGIDPGGRIYFSEDTGANWAETQPAGTGEKLWLANGVSGDGKVILAGNQPAGSTPYGRLYISFYEGTEVFKTIQFF